MKRRMTFRIPTSETIATAWSCMNCDVLGSKHATIPATLTMKFTTAVLLVNTDFGGVGGTTSAVSLLSVTVGLHQRLARQNNALSACGRRCDGGLGRPRQPRAQHRAYRRPP